MHPPKILPMRLARMIALSSELSRRAAEKSILAGEVRVNKEIVTVLGTIVTPSVDQICLNGRELHLPKNFHYIAFYKPRGALVTKSDPQGRPTIWDCLEELRERLNAVGRLDYDSEGLLLLTDDGDFLNRMIHPRHEVVKLYQVKVRGEPGAEAIFKLQNGVVLEDGRTLPAKVKIIDHGDNCTLLEIGIREGRNRQIRRMCAKVGLPVTHLKRISIGSLKLGTLKPGMWRHLKSQEVWALIEGAK